MPSFTLLPSSRLLLGPPIQQTQLAARRQGSTLKQLLWDSFGALSV